MEDFFVKSQFSVPPIWVKGSEKQVALNTGIQASKGYPELVHWQKIIQAKVRHSLNLIWSQSYMLWFIASSTN